MTRQRAASIHYVEGCTAPMYSTESLHSAVVEIIVKRGARCRYTTIRNWANIVSKSISKNGGRSSHRGLVKVEQGAKHARCKVVCEALILSGFIEPLVKELPMEYAVELNRLIELQMEGSVG